MLGPTFIDEAFRLAHAVDPDAQLFYNDYEIEGDNPKGEAAYQLCKRLKAAGVPIAGIGFQMHVDPRSWPTADRIRRNVERYAALGLLVEFTEVDVPIGAVPGSIDEKLQRQRELTRDIVGACVAVDKCSGITFWGVTDGDSWLNDAHWGAMRGRAALPVAVQRGHAAEADRGRARGAGEDAAQVTPRAATRRSSARGCEPW